MFWRVGAPGPSIRISCEIACGFAAWMPSACTASTKRWCTSAVHTKRGFFCALPSASASSSSSAPSPPSASASSSAGVGTGRLRRPLLRAGGWGTGDAVWRSEPLLAVRLSAETRVRCARGGGADDDAPGVGVGDGDVVVVVGVAWSSPTACDCACCCCWIAATAPAGRVERAPCACLSAEWSAAPCTACSVCMWWCCRCWSIWPMFGPPTSACACCCWKSCCCTSCWTTSWRATPACEGAAPERVSSSSSLPELCVAVENCSSSPSAVSVDSVGSTAGTPASRPERSSWKLRDASSLPVLSESAMAALGGRGMRQGIQRRSQKLPRHRIRQASSTRRAWRSSSKIPMRLAAVNFWTIGRAHRCECAPRELLRTHGPFSGNENLALPELSEKTPPKIAIF